jgi:hypothetical protein
MHQKVLSLFTSIVWIISLGCPIVSFSQTSNTPTPPSVIDPKSALDGLPKEVFRDLKKDSSKNSPALKLADEKAKANLEGKTGTIEFKVKYTGEQAGMQTFSSPEDEIRIGGMAFNLELHVLLDPSQKAAADKIKVGSRLKASGKMYAYVMSGGTKPVLKIEFAKAVLIK